MEGHYELITLTSDIDSITSNTTEIFKIFFFKKRIALAIWRQIVSFCSNRGERAGGAMMLNSLKLAVSFKFFPVGKEI